MVKMLKERETATNTITITTATTTIEEKLQKYATNTTTTTNCKPSRGRTKRMQQQRRQRCVALSTLVWLFAIALAGLLTATDVAAVEASSKEAYFNGSAYLRLLTPMPIWDHSAISFRSCRGGEILAQQYNKNSIVISVLNDFLQVSLAGPAVIGPNNRLDVKLPYQLLDNSWHTLQFKYEYGNLYLYVDRASTIFANSTYNSQFLTNQDIGNEAAILILGNSFAGCLLDGPGLQFLNGSMTVQNAVFGPCPLSKGACSEHGLLTPRAQENACYNDPCMGHGTCTSHAGDYECQCTARYSGRNCQKDNGPPCAKQPCANGGTCQEDARGDYQCLCASHYSGQHCETEVNVHKLCQSSPCHNNGACVVLAGSTTFECECPKGFAGARCELDINECDIQPCQNNGTCIDRVNGFSCDCADTGYTGAFCQTNIDECEQNPCLNGGICFDTYGWYTCKCHPGWGGDICDKPISCQTQQCLNGGTCIDKPIGFHCICPPDYAGELCQLEPACPQCPIDSECIGGKCICKPGTSGPIGHCVALATTTPTIDVEFLTTDFKAAQATRHSQHQHQHQQQPQQQQQQARQLHLPACSSDVCFNGGTCAGSADNYTCMCAKGFKGHNCEQTLLDGGISVPAVMPINCNGTNGKCLNGGTCSLNGTHCYCVNGYTGDRCEKVEPCSAQNCQEPMQCAQNKCICPENKVCNQCAMQPCRNGGECIDLLNGDYDCKCAPGWTGRNCAQDIDECTLSPKICGNGICTNDEGGYRCYCTPGYTGIHCDSDVDECLSHPCLNGATCLNKVNAFECVCQPGYTGVNCEIDVDECASNPCSAGSTCNNLINNFTCTCIPGMTGRYCEIDIDDCVSTPCLHNGQCVDLLGGFRCDCAGTGYEGDTCALNIDECASDPCVNGAECIDQVNDYLCKCHKGYRGKNCEHDINECESNPCQFNGTCLERSNMTLYQLSNELILPTAFSQPFSYANASGYECICVPGIVGKNCETNINECESNPCSKHGVCNDGIGTYSCECDPGFEGASCEINIDECERYDPCQHGTCIDQVNDYNCDCDTNYGGKNCSVPLIGCTSAPCLNGGTCWPYLVNETVHLFNCSCEHGFQGEICQKSTTLSLVVSSLISVKTPRLEGYDISLQFRTTIPNGVLAFGTSSGQNEPVSYILELINGRLNLHSSLLNKWEGVFIGSKLNDSNWHKVFVAINTSHLVLSANDEQAIFPIGSYETANNSQPSFPVTYLGGTIPNLQSYLRHLTHQPTSFVGCMQDVVVNGKWIFPDEMPSPYLNLSNVVQGCPRTDQCQPNPCHSNGECTDLWHTFSCNCPRPFFGHTCEYNMTAATFGHENTTQSAVVVEASEVAKRAIRSILDISMFIRTREPTGQIFYLGSDLRKAPKKNIGDSHVAAKLHGGELLVMMQFNGTPEAYTVGGQKLDNGNVHFIEVVRNQTLVQVKLNGTEYFRKTLSNSGILTAEVLYLGVPPPTRESLFATSNETLGFDEPVSPKDDTSKDYFKGVIQDVKVSSGSYDMIVELFPLNVSDVRIPDPFGSVSIDRSSVLQGVVTDDLCRKNPCKHSAECHNTWNDYVCICPNGYKGKNCQEIEFCQLVTCPGNSTCQNIDDGYECITNVTFTGKERAPLAFYFSKELVADEMAKQLLKPSIELSYRTRFGGTLLYAEGHESYVRISVKQNKVHVSWKFGQNSETAQFTKEHNDGEWNRVHIRALNGKLEGGWKGWESMVDPTPAFIADMDQLAFQELLTNSNYVYLGGTPRGNTDTQRYKGCLGEARIGDLLLPYFTNAELYPHTENVSVRLQTQFRLNSSRPAEGCTVCFTSDCRNGGFCDAPTERYQCSCAKGYEGDDCGIDIDECLTTVCQNNAPCINKIADFECDCLPGFEGRYCETNIDECAPAPCLNGGNCTDLIAAYQCQCTEDFMGPQCEIFKQMTCENMPCRTGATCFNGYNTNTGNNYTCTCAAGYEGAQCDVPYCKALPCKNGGYCNLNNGDLPVCSCLPGYTGRYCEIDINECEPMPCQNGGKCTDSVNAFYCDCSGTGFRGLECEFDVNECEDELAYCGSVGHCVNLHGSFRCDCPAGLCGSFCNLSDPCVQGDGICANGGKCIEQCGMRVDYNCNCTAGFGGKNCTLAVQTKEAGPSTMDIAIIVVPVVALLLLIGCCLLVAFFVMARNKRATCGTYSPSAQEYCNPRLEMDDVLKVPPEERLI